MGSGKLSKKAIKREEGTSNRSPPPLYAAGDFLRQGASNPASAGKEPYRTPFRRDFQRLLHSPSFRRLAGKTQLFPGEEHDFYRTRLTHSLEVAQIAKSIAIRFNGTHPYFKRHPIDCDLVEFAAIGHDLGHPPFGHNGEYVLDELMRDSGGFEGNAQTLRIICRLEKKATNEYPPIRSFTADEDIRRGLNITARGLASVLKYDRIIPISKDQRSLTDREKPVKGYYKSETDIVAAIKANVAAVPPKKFKTIECSIMDVADDIAYSTYDIEDAFAAGFLNPIAILSFDDNTKKGMVAKIQEKIDTEFEDQPAANRTLTLDFLNACLESVFASVITVDSEKYANETWTEEKLGAAVGGDVYRRSELIAKSPYHRTQFTSDLIALFINQIELVSLESSPVFWQVRPSFRVFTAIETLKMICFTQLIASGRFLAERKRAHHIISRIFRALESSGADLMTNDWRQVYDHYKDNPQEKKRVVCDFISGMTNRYCLEFYQRLFGVQPPSIYKP